MTKLITSAEIAGKIAALDTAVADWEADADNLSLQAVAGDTAAAEKLAKTNLQIEHGKADRRVLERAHKRAEKAEAAAQAKADAEARQRHIAEARLNAARLLDAATRIDQIIDQFAAGLREIEEAERALRTELIAARAMPQAGVRGRFTIGQEAIARLMKEVNGRARFKTDKDHGVSHWASVAWAHLLSPEDEAA